MTSDPEFDLTYRPETYWDPHDVLFANIMGDARKACVIDSINEGRLERLPPQAFAERAPEEEQKRLNSEGRGGFAGGEQLPAYLDGEVEIARITIDPKVRIVFAVRARREKSSILYRVVADPP